MVSPSGLRWAREVKVSGDGQRSEVKKRSFKGKHSTGMSMLPRHPPHQGWVSFSYPTCSRPHTLTGSVLSSTRSLRWDVTILVRPRECGWCGFSSKRWSCCRGQFHFRIGARNRREEASRWKERSRKVDGTGGTCVMIGMRWASQLPSSFSRARRPGTTAGGEAYCKGRCVRKVPRTCTPAHAACRSNYRWGWWQPRMGNSLRVRILGVGAI
ncbi:hypothetical protein R3P38DRAFT_543829 [Favolaschia claudopus]|uniref:Uncharacterized protein n=1 Tax=Favolaschia claudopus TaxID=2862362 RepID=A0AAW0CHT6_9AGAR